MILKFEDLTKLLDSSGVANQGVPAEMAFAIKFGQGKNDHGAVSYNTVSGVSIHLDIEANGEIVGLEFY